MDFFLKNRSNEIHSNEIRIRRELPVHAIIQKLLPCYYHLLLCFKQARPDRCQFLSLKVQYTVLKSLDMKCSKFFFKCKRD